MPDGGPEAGASGHFAVPQEKHAAAVEFSKQVVVGNAFREVVGWGWGEII